jgi:hypothetical protein
VAVEGVARYEVARKRVSRAWMKETMEGGSLSVVDIERFSKVSDGFVGACGVSWRTVIYLGQFLRRG